MNAHALQQRAAGIARDPAFAAGFRSMLATMLGIGAWGLVTGVAMVKAGMSVPLAIFMSLIVYAGSAQLAVLPLLMVGAPLWVVWFTATCVNLRFVILSSMWRHYFGHLRLLHRLTLGYFSGDVIFVTFTHRYPTPEKKPEQLPFFWGAAVANWVFWQVFSIAGILLANVLERAWAAYKYSVLEHGQAAYQQVRNLLKDKAAWLACVVACGAAVATFALPLKLNILVAIAAAVTAGLLMETAERRAARHLPQPAIRPPDPAKGEKFPVLPLPEDAARKEQP
mgnify:CR=1 FL=1